MVTERRVTAQKPERKRRDVIGLVRPGPAAPEPPHKQPPGPLRERRSELAITEDRVVDVVLIRP